jgi:putative DNA primase/helicase
VDDIHKGKFMSAIKRKVPSVTSTKDYSKINDLSPDYSATGENIAVSSAEILRNFRQAVLENIGYAPAMIDTSGTLHRFTSNGKTHDKAGWYVCHETRLLINGGNEWGIIGTFGDWRTGNTHQWNSYSTFFRLSREERRELERHQQAQAAQLRAQRQAAADQAHRQAVKMWLSAQPANATHPYLVRKRAGAYNIRQMGNLLLIPLCDLDGTLHSVQTIAPDGTKRFLSGTPKRGMFHLIGDQPDHPQGVYLCEGYATGASLYETYQLPVLVGFDAGNLLPVATAYRQRYPHTPLTVCADNDRKTAGNPGLTKAREVANALPGVGLIVPAFPEGTPLHLSDFNDLTALLGSNARKETNP